MRDEEKRRQKKCRQWIKFRRQVWHISQRVCKFLTETSFLMRLTHTTKVTYDAEDIILYRRSD